MTTGTILRQPPLTSGGTCGGSVRVGESTYKTWNGTDQPPVPKTYVLMSDVRGGYYAHGPKGQMVYIPRKERFFKKRIWSRAPKSRRFDEHPYTCSWWAKNNPIITWRQTGASDTKWGTVDNCFGGVSYPPTGIWSANDDIILLGKLREKIAGSDFNLGVAIAEGEEALQMIFKAAYRIDRAYRYARKGLMLHAAHMLVHGKDWKPPRQKTVVKTVQRTDIKAPTRRRRVDSVDGVASNWLELQYGWLPLLNDAYEGATFLAHNLNTPQQITVRAKLQRVNPGNGFQSASPSNLQPLKKVCYQKKAIKAILREKDIAQLSGLLDPLSIVWERLPYSFVIDWFLPVGQWLEARGLVSAISGTFVTSYKNDYRIDGFKYIGASWMYNFTGLSSYKFYGGDMSRTVSTSLSVPTPNFKPLNEVVSWRRAANAVSLLLQHRKTHVDPKRVDRGPNNLLQLEY